MTTISHEPSRVRQAWWSLLVPELWASLAIVGMWLAVLFDAVYVPGGAGVHFRRPTWAEVLGWEQELLVRGASLDPPEPGAGASSRVLAVMMTTPLPSLAGVASQHRESPCCGVR